MQKRGAESGKVTLMESLLIAGDIGGTKTLLALSQRLAVLPPSTHGADLTGKLYRAQANDAYWA